MLKNICEGYLEQKVKKMFEELLANRYKGIVKENKMYFKDYERNCFEEAVKVITEDVKKDDKEDNIDSSKQ